MRQRKRCTLMWRRFRKCLCLVACAGQWRQPSLFDDDTHTCCGAKAKVGTDYTQGVVHCVSGWKTWPIDMCSNKDADRSERETDPLVNTDRHKDSG